MHLATLIPRTLFFGSLLATIAVVTCRISSRVEGFTHSLGLLGIFRGTLAAPVEIATLLAKVPTRPRKHQTLRACLVGWSGFCRNWSPGVALRAPNYVLLPMARIALLGAQALHAILAPRVTQVPRSFCVARWHGRHGLSSHYLDALLDPFQHSAAMSCGQHFSVWLQCFSIQHLSEVYPRTPMLQGHLQRRAAPNVYQAQVGFVPHQQLHAVGNGCHKTPNSRLRVVALLVSQLG
jgi:hypothetical protein